MKLEQIYQPLTAAPFRHDHTYMELEPCNMLKSMIRCFWGTELPGTRTKNSHTGGEPAGSLVTPDTCMDIIFTFDEEGNQISHNFCGLNDCSFHAHTGNQKRQYSVFAIRFYAWAAVLFSEDTLRDSKNIYCSAEQYFPELVRRMASSLAYVQSLAERKRIAEQYLLQHCHLERSNPIVMETVLQILQKRGNVKTLQLARENHVSSRHLERLFRESMGISPKLLSSLVRYQYLWRDVLIQKEFHMLDAVWRYGYADQSHLLHDFKRFHLLSVKEAKEYAWKHVAFLQDKQQRIL